MSSSQSPAWRRWLQRRVPFLFRKGPICGNFHWIWDRWCHCCIGEYHGSHNGGVYDLWRVS